ncbi:MAG: argininosuccinate lyase [Candidatus Micrarchaeota archaeon]
MKLWDKGGSTESEIEKYTVGNDYLLDLQLVKYDCLASIAHAKMLAKIGAISAQEAAQLIGGLNEIIRLAEDGKFEILQEDEDCHTAIEKYLTKKFGEAGKKIHTARSRNDQILTALRLYEKEKLGEIRSLMQAHILAIEAAKKKWANMPLPGYTHMQRAMPSSVALWLGCYEDSMKDNFILINATLELLNQSPLGTGAGYGIPVFKIDREMETKEMGFARVQKNPIYAQHSRPKFEGELISALSAIMYDLNRLASDLILFNTAEFGFATLPNSYTTGSSIMPQKKNPDVLELMRAKYHVVLAEELKVKSISSNLMHGYNRDAQLTKEPLMNSFDIAISSLKIASMLFENLQFNEQNIKKAMTGELYATEEAYKLAKEGMPFRDAYKKVGEKYKKQQ